MGIAEGGAGGGKAAGKREKAPNANANMVQQAGIAQQLATPAGAHLLLGDGGGEVSLLAVAVHHVDGVAVVRPVLLVRHDKRVPQPGDLGEGVAGGGGASVERHKGLVLPLHRGLAKKSQVTGPSYKGRFNARTHAQQHHTGPISRSTTQTASGILCPTLANPFA